MDQTHYGLCRADGSEPVSLFEAVQTAVRILRYDAARRPDHSRVYRNPKYGATVEPPLVAVVYRMNHGDDVHVAVGPHATDAERRQVLRAAQGSQAPVGVLTFKQKAKPTPIPSGDLVVKPLIV